MSEAGIFNRESFPAIRRWNVVGHAAASLASGLRRESNETVRQGAFCRFPSYSRMFPTNASSGNAISADGDGAGIGSADRHPRCSHVIVRNTVASRRISLKLINVHILNLSVILSTTRKWTL